MRHRRLVADETARAVAQHRLFFGEDEGHEAGSENVSVVRFTLTSISSWPGLSRPSTSCLKERKTWMPGTRPGMTKNEIFARALTPPADRESVLPRCRA